MLVTRPRSRSPNRMSQLMKTVLGSQSKSQDLESSAPAPLENAWPRSDLHFSGVDEPNCGPLPADHWGPPETPYVVANKKDAEDVVDTAGRFGTKGPKHGDFKKDRTDVFCLLDGSCNRIERLDGEGWPKLDMDGNIVSILLTLQAISKIIREYFNGSYPTWGSVPKKHREFYWHNFGMRCKWTDPDINVAAA